jgi:hypothetical protein
MSTTKKAYEGLKPGVFPASVIDWGIREAQVSTTSKQLLAYIVLDIECENKVHRMTWEGFFFKKDGDVNSKTMNTLYACGFKGSDIAILQGDSALNTFSQGECDRRT